LAPPKTKKKKQNKNTNDINLCKLQHPLFILHFIKARL